MSVRTMEIILGAYEQQRVAISGKFIRFDAADYDVNFITPSGDNIRMKKNKALRHPLGFTHFDLVNTANTVNNITVEVGDGEIVSPEISSTVAVDGVIETAPDFTRVMNDQAFAIGWTVAAVAAQYSYMQLWNPTGSGKNLILNGLHINYAQKALINQYIQELNTQPVKANYATYPARSMFCKASGNVTSTGKAEGCTSTATTLTMTSYGVVGSLFNTPTGFNGFVELANPVVIGENAGFTVAGDTINTALSVIFMFFEEII